MKVGRLPAGLTFSMFTTAVSIGLLVVCWNLRWPTDSPWALVAHGGAAICVLWGAVEYLLCRLRPHLGETPVGRDLVAVLHVAQTIAGLFCAIIIFYVATLEVLIRIPSLPYYSYRQYLQVNLWQSGGLDLAVVAVVILVGWWRHHNYGLLTALFWLLMLSVLWGALQIPDLRAVQVGGVQRAVFVDWVSPMVLGAAFVVAAFTSLQGWLEHRRRLHAWPDRLDDLVSPAPVWPGFCYSVGLVSVGVLVAGGVFITSPWTPVSALLAGASLLALASRRWDENFADAALALITLAVVSLSMVGLQGYTPRAAFFASAFNRAVLSLAIMAGFWHWVAGVWMQQLDNEQPWTTAGRLIRPARRVGFLLGALAVLVSLELAFWPKMPYVDILDNSVWRWVSGLTANAALILILWAAARGTGKPTLAWLMAFAVVSALTFVVVRLEGTRAYTGFVQYWPVLIAAASAGLIVLAAWAARSEGWRMFVEPLYVFGIVIAPVVAIAGAALIESFMMPTWMPAATFAMLAGVYLLAALLPPRPRRFLLLTFACAAAGVWHLPRG